MKILAGDIGGTHTRLALFDEKGQHSNLEIYSSREFHNLESIIKKYLYNKKDIPIQIGCFAVAGPIYEGVCRVTNLPWIVDTKAIQTTFSFSKAFLINDLEANAHSISVLTTDNLYTLYDTSNKIQGNRVVVSPGTGLGEAGVYWDGKNYYPFACEGGHVDFAPVGELQIELYQYLQSHFDHVSYEIPLSGPGLSHIYHFLLDVKKREEELFLIEEKKQNDLSMLVTTHGIQHTSKICAEALDLFCELLAQESANMALKFLAYGGIYLGGGIIPKILPKIKEARFLERYFHKGSFRLLLEKMPLYAILDDKAALKGAAFFASKAIEASLLT